MNSSAIRTFAVHVKILVVVVLLHVAARTAGATTIIDQDNLNPPDGAFNVRGDVPTYYWEQEVTAGVNGTLVAIDLVAISTAPLPIQLYVKHGAAWQGGVPEYSQTVMPPPGDGSWLGTPFLVDTSAASFNLAAGEKFVIGFTNTAGEEWLGFNENDSYPGGALWLNGQLAGPTNAFGLYDARFRTHMQVPEPGSFALAALGLVGMAAWRRRCVAARHLDFSERRRQ